VGKNMPKLKIEKLEDEKPVTLSIKLPAGTHRDLVAYAELLKTEGEVSAEPKSLIAPMLKRFMATDRAFAKSRRALRREQSE
jgi:hypothetical protein